MISLFKANHVRKAHGRDAVPLRGLLEELHAQGALMNHLYKTLKQ